MSKINQAARARLAWDVLSAVAKEHRKITYGELGARIGVHHRAVRYVLSSIQDYCIESRLPPLTILVINGTGRPGTGFIAHDPNDLEQGFEEVWNYTWNATQNPFDFASEGLSFDDLISALITDPDEAGIVYAKVKSRGMLQILFREAVRKAYAFRCAFTGMAFPHALDACHIISWEAGTPQQRMDVRNGLLLNPLHHRLFDKAYLTITEDYRIVYWDPLAEQRRHSPVEAALTVALHNQKMQVPHSMLCRPLPEYIRAHNISCGWEL